MQTLTRAERRALTPEQAAAALAAIAARKAASAPQKPAKAPPLSHITPGRHTAPQGTQERATHRAPWPWGGTQRCVVLDDSDPESVVCAVVGGHAAGILLRAPASTLESLAKPEPVTIANDPRQVALF